MGDLFQPWHLIILAIIVIVLFGGKKLPELEAIDVTGRDPGDVADQLLALWLGTSTAGG